MRYLIILLLFCGCSATKQSTKFFKKSYDASKVQNAIESRKAWPCIPKATKTDSTEYKKYLAAIDSINKYYEDNPFITPPEYITDTMPNYDMEYYLNNLIEKYKAAYLTEVKHSAQLTAAAKAFKPIRDTVTKLDSNYNYLIRDKYQKDSTNFVKNTDQVVKENAKLQNKVSTKNTIIYFLIGLVLLILLLCFFAVRSLMNRKIMP